MLPNPHFSLNLYFPPLLHREAAADEDPSQGIFPASHRHRRADLHIPKGVQAGHGFKEGFLVQVAEIRALRKRKCPEPLLLPWFCPPVEWVSTATRRAQERQEEKGLGVMEEQE